MPGMQANPAPANPAPPASNVPMSDPVLTLKGACQPKSGGTPPAGCVSGLTREQFEKLTDALQPPDKGPVPPEVRRRFATQYAKLLTFADAARELGLENDPKVLQIYRFAMNQILAESLNQHYMEEFAHPSDQQIQEYYDQNVKKYKEVTLQRIIIPVYQAQATADKPKPTEAEQKAYGEKIRERWLAGEDPTKLEKEIMDHNGVTTPPPDVNVGARREGSLPQAHASVFELKPNEISESFSDATAVYIYKVVSERQVPLSEVKASISQTLQQQMFKDKIQSVQDAVTPVLNEAYFGPEPPPAPPHNMMRPGMPGAGAPPPPPPPPHSSGPGAGAGAPGTPPAMSPPSPQ
ncbi:MAG: peptidylprolyl isomerase [Candidatus Korobacteraceae bacterium]